MSLYLYTCIPVVGPVGSSGRCPLPGSLGSGVHRLIREMGPQARQGVSPEWGHRAAGSSGLWAHRLIGAQGPHPDKQGMQTRKKSVHGVPGLRGAPVRKSGQQARRGVGAYRHVGESGAPSTSGGWDHRLIGESGPSARRAPRPGSQTKMVELQCSWKSSSGSLSSRSQEP